MNLDAPVFLGEPSGLPVGLYVSDSSEWGRADPLTTDVFFACADRYGDEWTLAVRKAIEIGCGYYSTKVKPRHVRHRKMDDGRWQLSWTMPAGNGCGKTLECNTEEEAMECAEQAEKKLNLRLEISRKPVRFDWREPCVQSPVSVMVVSTRGSKTFRLPRHVYARVVYATSNMKGYISDKAFLVMSMRRYIAGSVSADGPLAHVPVNRVSG